MRLSLRRSSSERSHEEMMRSSTGSRSPAQREEQATHPARLESLSPPPSSPLEWTPRGFFHGDLTRACACGDSTRVRFRLSTPPLVAREALPQGEALAALKELLHSGRPELPQLSWSACSTQVKQLHAVPYHPFVAAAQIAFAEHRPLVLGPEEFWLLLAQGFSNHVLENAEALRQHFVTHEGKKKLVVRRNDFVLDSPHNPWEEVIDAFCDQIRDHVQKRYDLMVSNFSTTTEITHTASCVTMMDALQSYFEYEFRTLCGIPEIELRGSTDDWIAIRNRVQAFEEFELGWWVKALTPILDELVESAKGNINKEFWSSFFKYSQQSGGPYIHGWIHYLFPYLREGKALTKNPYLELGLGEQRGPTTDQFPSALSQAPVQWEYHGQSIPMSFIGGFFGVQQGEDLSLRPEIGWAIAREPSSR